MAEDNEVIEYYGVVQVDNLGANPDFDSPFAYYGADPAIARTEDDAEDLRGDVLDFENIDAGTEEAERFKVTKIEVTVPSE